MANSPNTADLYAGSKLRLQRQIRHMSQTDLARSLGVTFQQVQKYEKGVNRISASRLQNAASILGVPVSFFFKDDDVPSTTTAEQHEPNDGGISGFLYSREGLTLNRHFIAIEDAKTRKAIVNLVKALAAMEEGADLSAPDGSESSDETDDQA
jgi:transcriptional regulator with XRE-family HTH domain